MARSLNSPRTGAVSQPEALVAITVATPRVETALASSPTCVSPAGRQAAMTRSLKSPRTGAVSQPEALVAAQPQQREHHERRLGGLACPPSLGAHGSYPTVALGGVRRRAEVGDLTSPPSTTSMRGRGAERGTGVQLQQATRLRPSGRFAGWIGQTSTSEGDLIRGTRMDRQPCRGWGPPAPLHKKLA